MEIFISESKTRISESTLPKFKKPRKQGAVIPYMFDDKGNILIVLIKSKHGGNWGLPKGAIEKHLTNKKSAKMEALEEAGLKGKMGMKIGEYEYVKGLTERKQHVRVYPMLVKKMLKTYLESKWRIREVMPAHKAIKKLKKKQSVLVKALVLELSKQRL